MFSAAFALLALLALPLQAVAGEIRFIAAAELHACAGASAPSAICLAPGARELSEQGWRITLVTIPAYRSGSGVLSLTDDQRPDTPRITNDKSILIPLPAPAAPLTADLRRPLWIIWQQSPHIAWRAPALTPAAAAQAIAERKRQAALAKRMADRAFYFGYDANNDALK